MNISEEDIVFHCEVSKSLEQWVYVEGQLERITLLCIPGPSRPSVGAAYASIETFYAKLRFCDNLVLSTFRGSLHIERWQAAFESAVRLVGARNKIAHGLRCLYSSNTIGRRFAIVDIRPSDGRMPHTTGAKPPSGSLCVLDLARITHEFHVLTTDLCNVHDLFDVGREPFPKRVSQVESQPTIRSVRNQMRAALGLPLLPSRKKSLPLDQT